MKTNGILATVFVVLLVPVVMKFFGDKKVYLDLDRVPRLFEGFTPENVGMVQISRPIPKATPGPEDKVQMETLQFQKSEGKWLIGSGSFQGLQAKETELMSRIFDPLKKIQVSPTSVIVEKADEKQLKAYGLDVNSAQRIVCMDGSGTSVLADLLIGREAGGKDLGAQATQGVYVRKNGQKAILLYDEPITLDFDAQAWMEKNVLDIPEAEIESITLRNIKGEISFERKPGKGFVVTKGKPKDAGNLKQFEVTGLIGRARTLYAADFVAINDPSKWGAYQLDPPRIEVLMKTKDGRDHGFRIGKKVEGKQEYYAVVLKGRILFTLKEWDVTPLEKGPGSFFDPKALKSGKEKGGTTTKPQKK
ncbi:MAG TPA: DUF4340 domain-containing protein [Planctomycetes bacterium]|nr:DUF4340 domain-containing protein [Planctomycetota bacterium]